MSLDKLDEVIVYNNGNMPVYLLIAREDGRLHIHVSDHHQPNYETLTVAQYTRPIKITGWLEPESSSVSRSSPMSRLAIVSWQTVVNGLGLPGGGLGSRVQIGDYFLDGRLKELRSVKNPNDVFKLNDFEVQWFQNHAEVAKSSHQPKTKKEWEDYYAGRFK